MSTRDMSFHNTISMEIDGAQQWGWEYLCKDCGFKAAFFWDAKRKVHKIVVYNLGDPMVRHLRIQRTGRPWPVQDRSSRVHIMPGFDDFDGESWLTTAALKILEEIVSGLED